ncbi:hypothetical protein TWF481_010970 [Arthrobotrys musiformis]|uniref:Uncharacterized protein n=1 Tax=Arthrobotrys musiformis TaxID=47236 RepID=A0AAV9VX08_9PEZI
MQLQYLTLALFTALAAAGVVPPSAQPTPRTTTVFKPTTRTTTKWTPTTRSTQTTITKLPTPRPTTTTPKKPCTISLCYDGVNECGMMYGGCFPACPDSPTPTFSPPPCPTPTPKECDIHLCVDAINECGQMYGGCFPACPGIPTPTFTPPPCPSKWTGPPIVTRLPTRPARV